MAKTNCKKGSRVASPPRSEWAWHGFEVVPSSPFPLISQQQSPDSIVSSISQLPLLSFLSARLARSQERLFPLNSNT